MTIQELDNFIHRQQLSLFQISLKNGKWNLTIICKSNTAEYTIGCRPMQSGTLEQVIRNAIQEIEG